MRRLLPFFLLFVPFVLRSQYFDSACSQQKQVLSLLNSYHFDPPPQSKTTTRQILDLFVRTADEKNIFFIQQDTAILNGLIGKDPGSEVYCQAIRESYTIFSRRLFQIDSIATEIEKKPLVLDGKDTINFVYQRRDRQYCPGLAELSKRIEKRVKYDALQYLSSPHTMLASANVLREEPLQLPLQKAKNRSVQKFRRSIAGFHAPGHILTHLSDCMSNAIAKRYDPHSNYFNSAEMVKYRKAISTHERSFGFSVAENKNGEHVLSDLVPGGPAWKSDDLSENDVIASLRISGAEVPLSDMDVDEINAQIENAGSEDLSLTVISSDLQVRQVTLFREKIHSVDNTLNSYVVTSHGKRLGFIPIPSFYMDQDGENKNGLANDVAKEIVELKKDSVQGIILDLRFNGGGSMREAIALAGLFIDEGPVAIYKHKDAEPFLLKDVNRGTAWDGPLLILINSASASASEFVTAALQDYNRAVIAGSESFGKGTAQNVVPADTAAAEKKMQENDYDGGYLKITGGKFYRLNAHSHQSKGITPNIPIPGVIEKILERESTYPYALPCDSVDKAVQYRPLPPLPIGELARLSKARMRGSARFANIGRMADSLGVVALQTERVPLSIPEFRKYNDRQKKLTMQIESLFKGSDSSIHIHDNSSNQPVLSMSPFLKRSSEKTISALEQDVTFQESVFIMSDLIDLSKE
jgi:carboxyl-terminal processing protease